MVQGYYFEEKVNNLLISHGSVLTDHTITSLFSCTEYMRLRCAPLLLMTARSHHTGCVLTQKCFELVNKTTDPSQYSILNP